MVKLIVFNMDAFLQVVNQCNGSVYLLKKDGRRENINKDYDTQEYLRRKHQVNQDYSRLSLEIPDSKDYISIVSYNMGNL